MDKGQINTEENSDIKMVDGKMQMSIQREEGSTPNSTESNDTETDTAVADKYKDKSIEDLIKMNEEATKKITELASNKSKPTETNDDAGQGLGNIGEEGKEVKEETNSSEIDYEKIKNDFMKSESNELSEEVISQLSKSGQSEFLIEQFKNSLVSEKSNVVRSAKEFEQSIYDKVGGRETYIELMKTVKENLGDDEIASYKEVLNSNNPKAINNMIDFYSMKFADSLKNKDTQNQTNEVQGNSLNGSTVNGDISVKYNSRAEYNSDLNNNNYKRDSNFRKSVNDKAKSSGFIG